jgi:hypothetical protein
MAALKKSLAGGSRPAAKKTSGSASVSKLPKPKSKR